MPLGRQKSFVRVAAGGGAIVKVAYPARVIPSEFSLSWLLFKQRATPPAADQTIEECGNGTTRGYRLEYTTGEQIRFTTYSGAGASSVLSSNALTGEDNVFFFVDASHTAAQNVVVLNETRTTAVPLGAMAAPTSVDDRFLLSDAALASPLTACWAAQCALGFMNWLGVANMYPTIRGAQRLLEQSSYLSYIDWTRLVGSSAGGQTAHFGDSVTGARVDVASGAATGIYVRADRTTDWSAA